MLWVKSESAAEGPAAFCLLDMQPCASMRHTRHAEGIWREDKIFTCCLAALMYGWAIESCNMVPKRTMGGRGESGEGRYQAKCEGGQLPE